MLDLPKSLLIALSSCFAFGCESPPESEAQAADHTTDQAETATPDPKPALELGPIGQWVIDVERTLAEAMKLPEADRPPIEAIRGQMTSMTITLAEDGVLTMDPGIPSVESRLGRWSADGNELKLETNGQGRDPSRVYLSDSDELILEDSNEGRIWTMVLRRADG
ncbi:MAG: hypothetical protein AAF196_02530 [Planctomycetota bacterium]